MQGDDQNQAMNQRPDLPQTSVPHEAGTRGASTPADAASPAASLCTSTDVCSTPAPSQAAPNSEFPPFSFATSVELPCPDTCGAAIGIPIPLQTVRRGSHSGSTLPPLPSKAVRAAPPLSSADAATPETSVSQSPMHLQMPPRLQYRRVFVPSTVIHNGVAQQMLIPMMCMVHARTGGPAASPLRGNAYTTPAAQPGTPAARECDVKSPQMPATPLQHSAPSSSGRNKRKAQSREDSKPLGPAYVPLRCTSRQSRYGTRSSKLPKVDSKAGTPESQELTEREVMRGEVDALDMLADAALLDLC